MKRHDSLIPLSRDHHRALLLAQLIKKDAPAYKGLPTDLKGKVDYTVKTYQEELLPHFKIEEEVLFPNVTGVDREIDELVRELKEEHRKIREYVENIERSSSGHVNLLDELGHLISAHVRKEERELFQKVQKVLNEDDLTVIGQLIEGMHH